MRFFPSGFWVFAVVIAFISGRLIWIYTERPPHGREIASAFGSIGLIYGGAQINHDGSQFTYVGTSDKGYALFLCDTATGRKHIVFEENDGVSALGEYFTDLQAWPWSPDDGSFIYFAHDKLVICPSDTNKTSAQLTIGENAPSDLVWLNPEEFAYVVGKTRLCYAQMQANGQWELHQLPDKGGSSMASLTAVATNAVAWVQDNFICRINLTCDLAGTNNPFASLVPDTNAGPSRNGLTLTNAAPPRNGLTLWLDASTLQQADQTPVDNLADLSVSKNDAIANGDAPTYNASDSPLALNRRGTIHFVSANSAPSATGLKTSNRLGITGPMPRTVFVVMRRNIGRQMLINIGEFGRRGAYFGLCDQNNYLYLPSGFFPGNRSDQIPPLADTWNIFEVVYDGSSQKGYVNGILKDTSTLPINTIDNEVEIGARNANSVGKYAAGSDGDFAELLIYNRALKSTDRQQVEDYLSAKWFGSKLLSAHSPIIWLDPQISGITGFSYSKETGQFLISCAEGGRDSLWRLDSRTDEASQLAQAYSIRDAQWVGEKKYAFASRETGNRSVVLADSSGAERTSLFAGNYVDWFRVTSDEKKLLFEGTVSNEPDVGIWQYDFASKQLKSVVPCSDYPFTYTSNVIPSHGSIKLPSGRSLGYTIYSPANFNPSQHKKYPLIIGNTWFGRRFQTAHGRLWAPAIAACGAYVVVVERADWWGGIDQWEENVMNVYQSRIQNSHIDPQRVFLFASSVESQYLGECIAKSPNLWKGAILLNPTQLPDFSNSPSGQQRPKILISAGEAEQHKTDQLKKYQEDALKFGVIAEVIVHPGEGHHLIGNAAQLERTKAMVHFIFDE